MAIKAPRRFRSRHGIYGVRFIVPKRARVAVGKREIRVSLRTRDPELARQLALQLSLEFERNLRMASRKSSSPDASRVDWTMTFPNGATLEVKDAADQERANQFLRANPSFAQALTQATTGAPAVPAAAEPLTPVPVPTQLDEVINQHLLQEETVARLTPRTIEEKRRAIGHFTAYLADKHELQPWAFVHQVTGAMVMGFIQTHAQRDGKRADGGALDAQTLTKIVGHLTKMFDHAIALQALTLNPCTVAMPVLKPSLKRASRGRNSYKPFQATEVVKIFDPAPYLAQMNAGDYFWVPLLGLGTGARLGELVTMRVSSVSRDARSEVWTIAVTEESAKNLNSIRLVPLPQRLIDIGFIDYWKKVQSLGSEFLFPFPDIEGRTWKLDPSKNVSRAFGAYLDTLGELKDPRKVFHSLRHTVCTKLSIKGVPLGDAKQIVGHMAQEELSYFGGGTGTSSGARGGDVHLDSYTHAGELEVGGVPVMRRFQGHLDKALDYPLPWDKLAAAARIVLDHVKRPSPDSPRFDSGWHTNAAAYRASMLELLASGPSAS